MNVQRLILVCLLVAALTVGTTVVVYTAKQAVGLPKGTRSIPYVFSVAQYPGVDVGTDMFRLGALMQGGSSDRTLSISDALTQVVASNQTVASVRIVPIGKGSEWIKITPAEATLPATVKVSVSVPKDAVLGTYRGYLLVIPVTFKD